jgi:hypothetical protein
MHKWLAAAISLLASAGAFADVINCPAGATLHRSEGLGDTTELICLLDDVKEPTPHGAVAVLRPDGSVLYRGSFDHGKANGDFTRLRRDGTVESGARYVGGAKVGSLTPANTVDRVAP